MNNIAYIEKNQSEHKDIEKSRSHSLANVPFSVFEKIVARLQEFKSEDVIGFHQGKTTIPPIVDMTHWDEEFSLDSYFHAPPQGIHMLKEAIRQKHLKTNSVDFSNDELMVTCGATQAIKIASEAVLNPTDEAVILSPQWLFAAGVLKSVNANVKEVPFFIDLIDNPDLDIYDYLSEHVSENTKLLYFNTPNNPTGYSLSHAQLQQIVKFCLDNSIWIIADNAYEAYDFSNNGFIDIRDVEGAAEISFSVYSFSKTHLMPGYRIGYLISPQSVAEDLKKRGLFTLYSVATPSQYSAWKALQVPVERINFQRDVVLNAANLTQKHLNVPHLGFSGGFYLFLDLRKLGTNGSAIFIQELLDKGVSLAPGSVFGKNMECYARLCFTSVPEKKLVRGLEIINHCYAMQLSNIKEQ